MTSDHDIFLCMNLLSYIHYIYAMILRSIILNEVIFLRRCPCPILQFVFVF